MTARRARGGSVPRPKAAIAAHITACEAIRALETLLEGGRLTQKNHRDLRHLAEAAKREADETQDGPSCP